MSVKLQILALIYNAVNKGETSASGRRDEKKHTQKKTHLRCTHTEVEEIERGFGVFPLFSSKPSLLSENISTHKRRINLPPEKKSKKMRGFGGRW